MEWQPIETAPKDGTWILLYCPGGLDERDYDVEDAPRVTVGNFSPSDLQSARWLSVETWTEMYDFGGATGAGTMTYRQPVTPSHWMAIPEYPKAA